MGSEEAEAVFGDVVVNSRRGKLVTCAVVVGGLVVVASAGLAFRWPITERYYIWKLESRDKAERDHAAAKLGEMRSIRAIPSLVEALTIFAFMDTYSGSPDAKIKVDECAAAGALVRIGSPAVPSLLDELNDVRSWRRFSVAGVLGEIGPEAKLAIPALRVLGAASARRPRDAGWLRVAAAQALRKIQQTDE